MRAAAALHFVRGAPVAANAEEVDLTICSLDDPEAASPQDHPFASQRLRWMGVDDMPAWPRTRNQKE